MTSTDTPTPDAVVDDAPAIDTAPDAADTGAAAADDASPDAAPQDVADPGDEAVEDEGRVSDYKSGRAFADFPLSPEVLEGLKGIGYEEATQVQAEAIEPGLAGKDLLVRAKTGTGKTCAFGVPIIEALEPGARKVQGLVLSPTRELANQIARELAGIAKFKDVRILTIYGGVAMGPQEQALEEGVELVVGTPGRVLDHLRRGNLDLSESKIACLDEADEMLSMGFFQDVTKILSKLAKGSQLLMFSATVNAEVKKLIARFLNDPIDIYLSTDTDHVDGITHILYETGPDYHRVKALMAVIDAEKPDNAIVFCNTREDTATIATYLDKQGVPCQLLSGELPQKKREQVMAKMKAGAIRVLAATDVAARGIDISNLTHVFNYNLPQDPAVYMHRIGRTGRIGKEGWAISLSGGQDLATRMVLEKQFNVQFEIKPLPTPQEAAELRMTQQVQKLKEIAGTTAFEGYLPLVRALKDKPGGEVLLATAMRVCFDFDRQLRAAQAGVDSLGALSEAKAEKREGRRDRGDRDGGRGGRGGRGGGGGRDRDRKRRDDGDRPRRSRRDGGDNRDSRPSSSGGGGGGGATSAPTKRRRRRRRKGSGDGS